MTNLNNSDKLIDNLNLSRKWTLYFHSKDHEKKYMENMIKLIDIDTIQLFWQTYNNIPEVINLFSKNGNYKNIKITFPGKEPDTYIPSAYSFFDSKILPTWESTRLGGELSIREVDLENIQRMWKIILVSIISEEYKYSTDIDGARIVDSSYNEVNNYRLELWINNLENLSSHKKYLINLLGLNRKIKFLFREHVEIEEK